MPPTVLVADDHPLFREALRHALDRAIPGAEVIEADTVAALIAVAEGHAQADLLLLDLNMPGAQGFSALVQMRAHYPTLPVVIISANEDPAIIRRAIAHGAAGFVPKSSSVEQMVTALGAVLEGDVWTSTRRGSTTPRRISPSGSARSRHSSSACSRCCPRACSTSRSPGSSACRRPPSRPT
jgi:DNA-binding NarL/FixJ family response regulator